MNRMGLGDRIRTILITAVLTSIAWVLAGGSIIEAFGDGVMSLRLTDPAPQSEVELPPAEADRGVSEVGNVVRSPHREDARPLDYQAAGGFAIPVQGVRSSELIDSFTDARGGGERVHEAIDIMADRGTPVTAAQSGTIEKIFESDRGGKTLYIRSPDKRTITYYAHLDSYASGLKEGQQVRRGSRLGTVGSSGNASPEAPHLHFAIMQTTPDAGWWEPANAVNPYPVLLGKTP